MGLETGSKIEDLNPAWPLDSDDLEEADDHMRLIKTCVQGSFPSLGPDAMVRTAGELNDVVLTFNGRSPTSNNIVPQDGDYTLDELGGVVIGSESNGQSIIRRGGLWVNDKFDIKTGRYNTYNGLGSGDRIRVSNTIVDGSVSGLMNISPNNTTGFQAVAQDDCWFYLGVSMLGTSGGTESAFRVAFARNSGNSFPGFGSLLGVDSGFSDNNGDTAYASTGGWIQLGSGDAIYVYADVIRNSFTFDNVVITTMVRER